MNLNSQGQLSDSIPRRKSAAYSLSAAHPAEAVAEASPKEFLSGPGTAGLVSVVIPCFNRAHLVRETIDSVLAQTHEKLEAIIIDDGSVDNTRQVISEYGDPRVRYFYQDNGGLSSARNLGLNVARGEYIAFLDSDDAWHNWKLAAQVAIFRRHPEVGLVWSDMSTFERAGEIISDRHIRTYYSAYNEVSFENNHLSMGNLSDLIAERPEHLGDSPYFVADIFDMMFNGNLVHPPTAIVRRERLQKSGPFDTQITGAGAEDYHFYFRIASHGPAAFLDAPSMLYRVHPSQMSTLNRLNEARGNLNVVKHWVTTRPTTLSQAKMRRRLASSYAWQGAEELSAGNARTATQLLWRSLRLNFRQPSAARLLVVSLLPQGAASVLRVWKAALRNLITRPLIAILILLSQDAEIVFRVLALFQPEFAEL